MTNTVMIILFWYAIMVLLSWSSTEEEQEEQEEEEEEPQAERSLLDHPLLAIAGITNLYEEVEAVEVWDDVEYMEERPKRTPTVIVMEINKPLKISK